MFTVGDIVKLNVESNRHRVVPRPHLQANTHYIVTRVHPEQRNLIKFKTKNGNGYSAVSWHYDDRFMLVEHVANKEQVFDERDEFREPIRLNIRKKAA